MVYTKQAMVHFVLTMVFINSMRTSMADDVFFSDDLLEVTSLLQLRSVAKSAVRVTTNSNRSGDPGARERQQCPHEIEAELAARGNEVRFGCQGTSRAESVKECSFWGEPHVSRSWVGRPAGPGAFDVLYKPGLFRMAAAKDGSWEIQIFNCGTYAYSLAARFGKDVIEIVAATTTQLDYFLNGKKLSGSWPHELGRLFIDGTHRKAPGNNNLGRDRRPAGATGACIDDPGGQVYIDISQSTLGNINVLLEAATDSYTTAATDGYSFCNVQLESWHWHYFDWPVAMVSPEDSLFTSLGKDACKCTGAPTVNHVQYRTDAQATCDAMQQTNFPKYTIPQMCENQGVALIDAEAACVHLQNDDAFYKDCQFDFCAADADSGAVLEAEEEEHAENPQPTCAIADDTCDPAGACCNALRDQSILNFSSVTQNNLCGDDAGARELRYGSVLSQNAQMMDLVVTPVDDYDCGRASNDKHGNKGDALGLIAVTAGMSVSFKFQFVHSGTDDPITPSSLMFSFLDIDQGKNNKQRESVEVCGATNAIVTDNSELEQSTVGDCIKFTSTTHGTGQDNPEDPENMSDIQRARSVAYQVAGSSFTAKLSVSQKGRNPRKFMFAGNPSVACVLKD